MTPKEILEILFRFSNDTFSASDEHALEEWVNNADKKSIETIMEAYETIVMEAPVGKANEILLQQIKAKINLRTTAEVESHTSGIEYREEARVRRLFPWKQIAAALLIFVVGTALYFMVFDKKEPVRVARVTEVNEVAAPDKNAAVITLGNGQQIFLDSASNGTLALQGDVIVEKDLEGHIHYKVKKGATNSAEVSYNTLANPKGSKVIDLTLADGSRVWLNAGSTLTFPAAFTGKDRNVIVSGEAYFEVAHDVRKPFKVSKGDIEVMVLGTHFNVNAYDNNELVKVTLLEGSVKVLKFPASSSGKAELMLKPGQQAQAGTTDAMKLITHADIEQVMAWKNNLFNFNKTPVGDIMKQMERWYKVTVEYEDGKVPDITLSGIISRNISANKVLEMLELSGIHFKIDGKKIIVKSQSGK